MTTCFDMHGAGMPWHGARGLAAVDWFEQVVALLPVDLITITPHFGWALAVFNGEAAAISGGCRWLCCLQPPVFPWQANQ